MTSPTSKSRAATSRLYLVTPAIADAAAFAPELAAALEEADVAAVLLHLRDADERSQINVIKALASVVQDKGVALLIDGRIDLVNRGGADGAHLSGLEAFLESLDTIKPARIAGCGGLGSRHDAMVAAERGADYVMFGDAIDGRRPSFEAIEERVAWWAEVFEVPCVAFAERVEEIGALAAAGADFIAVGDAVWNDSRGSAAALRAVAAVLGATEPAA
jgi:thiamine-phosphate pyrophosphorylase